MRLIFSVITILLCICSVARGQTSDYRPLTLDQKIGQMIMLGFRGESLDGLDDLKQAIGQNRLGGVILFDYDAALKKRQRNIQSPRQLLQLTSALQGLSPMPLFIAVDQEGGRVARLNETNGHLRGLAASALGTINDDALSMKEFEQTAMQLHTTGINVNLAPVVDLCRNPQNPVIAQLGRCYSKDNDIVEHLASMFIDAHKQFNILTALKHFPGHGSSRSDSHLGYVDVSSSWSSGELLPFSDLIKANKADMIMVAHIFNKQIDPDFPASLSYKTITQLLIEKLGFSGLVLSDDLQMAAIQDYYSEEEILYRAISAGNDILVFGNNLDYEPELLVRKISVVKKLIADGKISKQRIEQSWLKIAKIKTRLQ